MASTTAFPLPHCQSADLCTLQCEELYFTLTLEAEVLVCRERLSSIRVPISIDGIQIDGVRRPGTEFWSCCSARFRPRKGVEVRLGLKGGGCCNSSALPRSGRMSSQDLHDLYSVKKLSIVQNQQLAQEIAEEVRDLSYKGINAGMRLSELDDIPQVSVKTPLAVAESLLEALDEEGFWSADSDFLIRQTIVRLARRHFMDYIFSERAHFVENRRERLSQQLTDIQASVRRRDALWPESGVLAELAVLKMFVRAANDTPRIWQRVCEASPELGIAFKSAGPQDSVATLAEISAFMSVPSGTNHTMEIQLLIDDLYFQSSTSRMDQLFQITSMLLSPAPHKSWKTLYLTLSYLEWCSHKGLITPEQAEGMKDTLRQFATIAGCAALGVGKNAWRLCEKLATLLTKASEQGMLEDLYQVVRTQEKDERIQRVLMLPGKILRMEPLPARRCNISHRLRPLLHRDSDLHRAKSILSSTHLLNISGPRGIGKSHFANTLAVMVSGGYDIVWLCAAETVTSLAVSVRILAWNAGITGDTPQVIETLARKRVLVVLDDVSQSVIGQWRKFLPENCHIIATSVDETTQEETIRLSPMEGSAAISLMIGDRSNDPRLPSVVKLVPGRPLTLTALGVLLSPSASPNDFSAVLTEDPDASEDRRQEKILQKCVRSLAIKSPAVSRLLTILAVLSPADAQEELYAPIFRCFCKIGDLAPAKVVVRNSLLASEDELGSFSMSREAQKAILAVCDGNDLRATFIAAVQVVQLLFSDECVSDTNCRMALSVESLVHQIMSKDSVESAEIRLSLKYVYFCIEKLSCGEHIKPLLEKTCTWYHLNPKVHDFHDMPVPYYIGTCFRRLGDLTHAAEYLLIEVIICEKTLPLDHPDLAACYELIASIFYQLNNLVAAENFQIKSVRIREKTTTPELAHAYSILSSIYHDQGRLSEAERAQLNAVAVLRQLPSNSNVELATLYSNLASIYQDQGNFPSALSYQEKAMKIDEEILPSNHADLATSYGNLSNIYRDMGDLPKALQYQAKALLIKEEVYSEDHPLLGISYHCMAKLLLSLGEGHRAEEYQDKALRIEENADPVNEQRLAKYLHTMAMVQKNIGKMHHALELVLREVKLRERIPGEEKELAVAYYEAGTISHSLSDSTTAKEYLGKAVSLRERVLPTYRDDLLACYRALTLVSSASEKLANRNN